MISRTHMTKKRTITDAHSEQLTEVTVIQSPIWKGKGGVFYAFSPIQNQNGKQNVIELTMKGSIVKSFLRSAALSHTVFIDASKADIEALKSFIKTAPGFNEEY